MPPARLPAANERRQTGEILSYMKSGFVSIIGKPNAGKSSLVNALVGEKVSIVSPKAQTTRDRINGILTRDDCQIVFSDTPGVHRPTSGLGRYMDKCVRSSAADADAIVVVIDVSRRVSDGDIALVEKYLRGDAPVFVALNKVDLCSYEKVYPVLERIKPLTVETEGRKAIRDVIPLSARKKKNVDVLLADIIAVLPEGPMYYPADEPTDRSERYMIAEIVREKALLLLGDELPHGIGVEVTDMFTQDNGVVRMSIDVIAEKESHKPMIIGSGGEKLKAIAERARKDVERLVGGKVYMELYVKVRENWRNSAAVMRDMGYDPKKV